MQCITCSKELSARKRAKKPTGFCKACYSGANNHSWSGGKPKCVDCNKELTVYGRTRCKPCNYKFYSGENHPRWTGGWQNNRPRCLTCNKQLAGQYGQFCKPHSGKKGKDSIHWKGGLPKCLECGKKLAGYNRKYCQACVNLGERSHYWKGGLTKISVSIRNSQKNKTWIKQVLKRDNWTCQLCPQRGGTLEVDHYPIPFATLMKKHDIKSKTQAFKVSEFWDINNGRTLCAPCHKGTINYLTRKETK